MKNGVGEMVTVQDGRPPVFDNYLIPPGEITLCATLRTDGYYYATSRECGNFKMCFVCSTPTEPVFTLKLRYYHKTGFGPFEKPGYHYSIVILYMYKVLTCNYFFIDVHMY